MHVVGLVLHPKRDCTGAVGSILEWAARRQIEVVGISTEINRLGGDCRETADGLEITATPMRPGTWHSYADHRMATAGAIVGLRVAGVEVDDIETTAKTLPRFPRMWADMLAPPDDAGRPAARGGERH